MNKDKYKKLVQKRYNVAFFKKVDDVVRSFSLTEKLIFGLFVFLFIGSTVLMLININEDFLVETPAYGGVLHEGVIGTPRFINPLIAVSGADRDLTSLVYSGLMRNSSYIDNEGNSVSELVPDLAERYEISEDKLEYRFFLRDDIKFHDGKAVTTDDIIFTLLKTQEVEIESPHRGKWEGIAIERISETELVFRLKQPYDNFLENTTLGVLPKHLWENILSNGFSLSKHNVEPVGSGPYRVSKVSRDSTNIPVSYTLTSFNKYAMGRPFINKIVLHFARNDEEVLEMFNDGTIDAMSGISAGAANEIVSSDTSSIETITRPLPRIFSIFLNPSESPVLANASVREALTAASPKSEIINDVLFGFADPANDPIPPHLETSDIGAVLDTSSVESKIAAAQIILDKAGWTKNDAGIYTREKNDETSLLSFTVSTSNVPELVTIAEKVVASWRAIGADVELKTFAVSDLNQTVIRPRNFDALLFGMVINEDTDLYAFWHSSQRTDPGLNISGYANITTDAALEDLRNGNLEDPETRSELLVEFNKNIKQDQPAVFLYTPQFIYVLRENVRGVEVDDVSGAEDRFINVHKWFLDTDEVWKVFNN